MPGIGPKSAAELLARVALEELLARPEGAPRERWRHLLVAHREQMVTARRIVAPVDVPRTKLAAALRPAEPR